MDETVEFFRIIGRAVSIAAFLIGWGIWVAHPQQTWFETAVLFMLAAIYVARVTHE